MAILKVSTCTKRFGGLVAVRNLNMSLDPGDLYGLIGPNGSGKSSLFDAFLMRYRIDSQYGRRRRLNGSKTPGIIAYQGVTVRIF